MQRIRSTDVDLVSSYLHDSVFLLRDTSFDQSGNLLAILLSRIYYEEPKRGRFLFLIPCTRFRCISSRLEIPNVVAVDYRWQDEAFNRPGDLHTLLRIRLIDDESLEVETEYVVLRVQLSRFTGILLTDTSGPTKGYRVTDLSRWQGYRDVVESMKKERME